MFDARPRSEPNITIFKRQPFNQDPMCWHVIFEHCIHMTNINAVCCTPLPLKYLYRNGKKSHLISSPVLRRVMPQHGRVLGHCPTQAKGKETVVVPTDSNSHVSSSSRLLLSIFTWTNQICLLLCRPEVIAWGLSLFFYSLITFSYTKCFVHSYTVDVVFTLSY